MRILHWSDAHADARSHGVDRYFDIEAACEQVVETAIAEKVDLVAFTGDLCDPDDGPAALRAVKLAYDVARRLQEASVPNWWVAGNHDVVEDGSGRTTLSPLAAMGNLVSVFEEPCINVAFGRAFIILPYTSTANAYNPVALLQNTRPKVEANAVVLSHLNVEGIVPGVETNDLPRGRDVFLPLEECGERWTILSGHYHERQTYVRAGRTVYVAGALARLTFGDEAIVPSFQIVTV